MATRAERNLPCPACAAWVPRTRRVCPNCGGPTPWNALALTQTRSIADLPDEPPPPKRRYPAPPPVTEAGEKVTEPPAPAAPPPVIEPDEDKEGQPENEDPDPTGSDPLETAAPPPATAVPPPSPLDPDGPQVILKDEALMLGASFVSLKKGQIINDFGLIQAVRRAGIAMAPASPENEDLAHCPACGHTFPIVTPSSQSNGDNMNLFRRRRSAAR